MLFRRVSAAAGGSLLGTLAVTMIPEGYREGGKLTVLILVFGFAFAAMPGVIGRSGDITHCLNGYSRTSPFEIKTGWKKHII
jgi:hypothetical protein